MSNPLTELRRQIKRAKDEFNGPPDVSYLFQDYYMPTDQRLYYEKLAQTDAKFLAITQLIKTDDFKQYLRERILTENNLLHFIAGQPGLGKSFIGIKIMQMTLEYRLEFLGKLNKMHFAFAPPELVDKIKAVDDADYVQLDEWKKLKGVGATSTLGDLENLMASMRFTKKSVNICTPMQVYFPEVTSIFVPFGQKKSYLLMNDAHNLICKFHRSFEFVYNYLIKLYGRSITIEQYRNIQAGLLKPNPDEMVSRVLWYASVGAQAKAKILPIGVIFLGMKSIIPLIPAYQKLKSDHHYRMEENRGGEGAITEERNSWITEIVEKLYTYAKSKGYPQTTNPGVKVLKTYLKDLRIPATGDDRDDIINKTVEKARADIKAKKDAEDAARQTAITSINPAPAPTGEFTWDETQFLEKFRHTSQSPHVVRNLELYELLKNPLTTSTTIMGMKNNDGSQKYPELKNRQTISEAVKPIVGFLNDEIGNLYERYYLPSLEAKYTRVVHDGGIGKMDFQCFDSKGNCVFISCKCLYFTTTLRMPYDQYEPEISEARKYYLQINKTLGKNESPKVPRVLVHIYNRYNKKVYTREVEESLLKSYVPYTTSKHMIKLEEFDNIAQV